MIRILGIMILIGIACFWAGRLTTPPKAAIYENKTYEIILEKVIKLRK